MTGSVGSKLRVLGQLGRIGGHVVLESIRRERPLDLAAVPQSARDLTSAWLTAAVCAE